MDPKIWGKAGWRFLFKVAINYPNKPNFEDSTNYMRFFTYLQYVLACGDCCMHYASNLNITPIIPYLTSKDNLFMWLLKMHNLVRSQLGQAPFSRKKAIDYYLDGQYESVDCRFDPEVWGLDGWKFFYSIAYGYPLIPTYQDIMNYKNFFIYLQYVLPCESYRKQYANQLNEVDINPFLTTQSYLFQWVLAMENMVNKYVGRKELNIQDVFNVYFNHQWGANFEKPPIGLGLIEKFTSNQSQNNHIPYELKLPIINWHDHYLVQKNLSMVILATLAGIFVYNT